MTIIDKKPVKITEERDYSNSILNQDLNILFLTGNNKQLLYDSRVKKYRLNN